MRKLNLILILSVILSLLSACGTLQQPEVVSKQDSSDRLSEVARAEPSPHSTENPEPEPADIWERIRKGYGLPPAEDPLIDNHLRWYANNQQHIDSFTQRSEPYIHHVVSELEAEGMPLELALLPIIESSYNPFAFSSHQAAGIWQFVPRTAKSFGLEQNTWYDGRRDVVASTDAAIRYLKRLHAMFDGDWLLALAAYNAGEGTLRRAIKRNLKEGKPTDFWSLPLPKQTQSYVPRLLALSRIIAGPDEFALTLASIPNDPYFTAIDLEAPVNMIELAQLVAMDIKELQQLNAGYSRWLTDPSRPHQLLVPVEVAPLVTEQLDLLPKQPELVWHEYTVIKGDTLSRIAKRFNTDIATLKKNNGLTKDALRVGQVLQIGEPISLAAEHPTAEELMRNYGRASGSYSIYHTVAPGENLWKIARQHRTSIAALTRMNNLSTQSTLKPGQKLIVSRQNQPALASTEDPHKMIYLIQPGDTLYTIANRFKLSTQKILEWNSVRDASYIHPGQKLTLFMNKER